jgi:ASC-1-like (ASCH) protein
MHYLLHLPERPFRSIKKGTKKVEGRVFRNTTPYHEMKSGDTITFVNEDTEEKMDVDVLFVHHYPDARKMLVAEGVENVSSYGGTIEESIKRYNSFTNYKENIPKYGIYAIGVKPIVKK